MSDQLGRRHFLLATSGALAAATTAPTGGLTASVQEPQNRKPRMKAISSHNGLEATRRAYELMQQDADTLDAAVAGVTIVENDPDDTSVGFGGLPNEDGVVELDAAVMHGPTHRAGAVAALRNIRHAASIAQLVMNHSDHVLLVGEGALRFAKAHGAEEENLLTDKARRIWLYWKQTLSKRDDWLPPDIDDVDPDVAKFFKLRRKAEKSDELPKTEQTPGGAASARAPQEFERPTGTIHCAAINKSGDMSCTTTTSGLAFKIPGRVGDSPIIGAGLYVDNSVGSCGSTGRGEANLQNMCCFAAVELMRGGMSPEEAGLEVLKRVAKTTEPRLLNDQGRPDFGLKFYLLAKDGRHAGVSMWGPADFAVTDGTGTRLEPCVALYTRSR